MPWSEGAERHLDDWRPVRPSLQSRSVVSLLAWSRAFRKQIINSSAEVLHTHGLWLQPSWVGLAWQQSDRPHVVSTRGMLEPWAWAHHRWKKRPIWAALERRNLSGASLIHATSPQEAHSVRARGITTPIAVIPNGVDLPHTTGAASAGQDGRRTALFMSRIHPKKGLPMLLEAWARVLPSDWQLVIAGPDEGGHRSELETIVERLDLQSHVSFVGPLNGEQKQDALLNCDLFVLPTHSENFGIAVAEAMAAGSPVITTHGAPWQVLEEEDCGWWVEASVDGLTAALSDAVASTDQSRTQMGQRGRRVAADRFSWKSIAAEMESCYRWILGQGPRPASIWE